MLNKIIASLFSLSIAVTASTATAAERPNILVIWGDDIGITNISEYSRGMMGYKTPNIDSIAKQGVLFTDYYGEQSCTAGRSAFITGQHPLRTGLTKVGTPGANIGIHPDDPTLAELLKPLGYFSGQFGKNHLGDQDKFLPTNHGFDEFFGNLYHLNAEEAPEDPDYPKDAAYNKRWGPRGVIHSYADGRVEDSGPLTKRRMESVDSEFLAASLDFMDRAVAQDKPFFVWFNSTRMHYFTHLAESEKGLSGQGMYNDAMVAHDNQVGQLLDKLKELGVDENTIVFYSTDNGVHYNTWPDAGITPFRSEKNTNWEGGFRVPAMVKWPASIPAGQVANGIMSHQDWVPTLMAAAGVTDIKQKLLAGHSVGERSFNVHLDGFNFLPYLKGETEKSPRQSFFYVSDDGNIMASRVGDWKYVFSEQRGSRHGVWREPFTTFRIPKLFNLRRDPFERADQNSNTYEEWWIRKISARFGQMQDSMAGFLGSFIKYPQRQRPASFTIDQMLEQIMQQSRAAQRPPEK